MGYMKISVLLLLSCLVLSCRGYEQYQRKIPNGENVPNPCKANQDWPGVGHAVAAGGGERNPFGVAFKSLLEWTKDFCQADSDGDGKTNGEELGDPDCLWLEGFGPSTTKGITHPGICEPIDSADCILKNLGMDCPIFECDGIGAADTKNVTLMMDKTSVPVQETTYMCQTLDLPDDQPYHLFASKPEIDDQDVIHHMLLYGCDNDVSGYTTPKECHMGSTKCSTLLSYWTIGLKGDCQRSSDGIAVGQGSFTKVMLQLHWHNPLLNTSKTDGSGITLFLTPNLRKNNLGYLVTGQEKIEIPGKTEEMTVHSSCKGYCILESLDKPIYITGAMLHMHYKGTGGKIEQFRANKLKKTLYSTSAYNYDLPVLKKFDPPLEILQADELKTVCTYSTSSDTQAISFGKSITDEMCYSYLNYYPATAAKGSCIMNGTEPPCTKKDEQSKGVRFYGTQAIMSLLILFVVLII